MYFFLVIRLWRTVTERSMYIYIYDLLTSFPLIFYQTASLSTFYDSLNIFMKKYMHQGFFLYDLLEMPDERNLQIHISLTAKRLKN